MNKQEIEQLESCESAGRVPRERGGTSFNEKERGFLADMRRKMIKRDLSPRQKLWLKQLSDRS